VATIRLANRVEELRTLERSLQDFFEQNRLPLKELSSVNLVLEELVSNAIFHAYADDAEHEILIRLDLEGDDLRIEMEDDGREFNPLLVPAPSIAPTLEQQQIGGLGLVLVKSLTNEIRYKRTEGKNQLTLVKTGIRS
jgi:serine/threonine-protein kinase RsbW